MHYSIQLCTCNTYYIFNIFTHINHNIYEIYETAHHYDPFILMYEKHY